MTLAQTAVADSRHEAWMGHAVCKALRNTQILRFGPLCKAEFRDHCDHGSTIWRVVGSADFVVSLLSGSFADLAPPRAPTIFRPARPQPNRSSTVSVVLVVTGAIF